MNFDMRPTHLHFSPKKPKFVVLCQSDLFVGLTSVMRSKGVKNDFLYTLALDYPVVDIVLVISIIVF